MDPFAAEVTVEFDEESTGVRELLANAEPVLTAALEEIAARCRQDQSAEGCDDDAPRYFPANPFEGFVGEQHNVNVQFTNVGIPVVSLDSQESTTDVVRWYGACVGVGYNYFGYSSAPVSANGELGTVTSTIDATVSSYGPTGGDGC